MADAQGQPARTRRQPLATALNRPPSLLANTATAARRVSQGEALCQRPELGVLDRRGDRQRRLRAARSCRGVLWGRPVGLKISGAGGYG